MNHKHTDTQAGSPATARVETRVEPRVDIYVVEGCHNCLFAKGVAEDIRRDFPTVQVRVIDMSATSDPIPEAVFATPTYLLNGRIWSLGNPSPQDIQARLSAATHNS